MWFTHLPTKIEAVLWDGDLEAAEAFARQADAEVVDDGAGLLWVTVHSPSRSVFPVIRGHWLVRWPNKRLASMSDISLRQLYQPALDLVS